MKIALYLLAASVAIVAWLAGLSMNYYGVSLVFAAIGYNMESPKPDALLPSGRPAASARPRPKEKKA